MTDPTIDKAALEAALNAVPSFAGGQSKVEGDRTIGDKLGFGHGTPNPRAYVEAAIAAYLAALPPTTDAVGVTVRELEWFDAGSGLGYEGSWHADSAGEYSIMLRAGVYEVFRSGRYPLGDDFEKNKFTTLEAAKAAAQADYTIRIMASLNISEAEPVAARRIEVDIGAAIKALEASPELADMMSKLLNPTTSEGVRDDVLDRDELLAITEHLLMLADIDDPDPAEPDCTDLCGTRVCDQLGCVVSKWRKVRT